MRIRRLTIKNYRLLGNIDLELGPGLNVLYGDNAAGKTSLLETLVCLSRGRVEGGNPRQCCGPASKDWLVEAWVASDWPQSSAIHDRLRMQWQKGLSFFINGVSTTTRNLSRQLIVAAVEPRSHELFDFGPGQRRRFLDWALFHVEPRYAESWSRWRRVLEQRNRALAESRDADVAWIWDPQLVETAMEIHRSRLSVVESIAGDLKETLVNLFGEEDINLRYEYGWNQNEAYEVVLSNQQLADRESGRTRSGPQRADLKITVGAMEVERLSRGQQKLLLTGLMVSASRHIERERKTWPLLLVDDFESELGGSSQDKMATMLSSYPGQSLVTQHRQQSALTQLAGASLFHVEHGKVHLTIQ